MWIQALVSLGKVGADSAQLVHSGKPEHFVLPQPLVVPYTTIIKQIGYTLMAQLTL